MADSLKANELSRLRTREALHRERSISMGRLLNRASRHYDAAILDHVHTCGHTSIRAPELRILRAIATTGSRISDIAHDTWMTKQGTGQVIKSLEKQGYIRSLLDPTDARVRIAVFTPAGVELMNDIADAFSQADSKFAECVGTDDLENVRVILERLVRKLGPIK